MSAPSPWWSPAVHADRRGFLHGRASILKAVRAWFDAEGFVEVEACALQVSPGNEAHLHGFATELAGPDGTAAAMHLHTSPEFACKKLLAAGETRIFDLAHVFRNRERGPLHHPEFTMLEWYRAGADYEALMADCAHLIALAAATVHAERFAYRGRSIDPLLPPERITVAEAFERHAGIDLLTTVSTDGGTDRDALAAQAAGAGIRVAGDDVWADIFSRILVEKVEPELGNGRASLLVDYPAPEAALARRSPADPRTAERFELYACGVELANGFSELTDPAEQRRRLEAEMDEKARVYGERYPIDEEFIEALAIMPEAAGCALGFDRLVMLATGAQRIDQVIWTPVA